MVTASDASYFHLPLFNARLATMALHVLAVREDVCREPLDLEIKCDQTVFRVHRAVVCAKSTVLAALCGNEAAQTTIELDETDSHTFKAVLNYMYTGDYELDSEIFGNIGTYAPGRQLQQHLLPGRTIAWCTADVSHC